MPDTDRQTRIFQVTLEEISAADTWIEQVGKNWGMAERTTFAARLCVAEIAANILEHGSSLDRPAQLTIALHRRNNGVDIELTDSGLPFDPTTFAGRPPSKTLDSDQIGGFGLHLVRSYASDIKYGHDGSCNYLALHVPEAVS